MTNQPPDCVALRALAESIIKHTSVIPFGPDNIDAADWCDMADPATLLALLDRIDALEAGQLRAVNAAFDRQTEVEYRFYELNVKHANHMADIETHYSQQLQREKDRNEALENENRELKRERDNCLDRENFG